MFLQPAVVSSRTHPQLGVESVSLGVSVTSAFPYDHQLEALSLIAQPTVSPALLDFPAIELLDVTVQTTATSIPALVLQGGPVYVEDVTAQPATQVATVFGPLLAADVTSQPSTTPVVAYDRVLDFLDVTTSPTVTETGNLVLHRFETADVTTSPTVTETGELVLHRFETADVVTSPMVTPAEAFDRILDFVNVVATPQVTPVTPYDHIFEALNVTAQPSVAPWLLEDRNTKAADVTTQPAVEPSTIYGPLTVADVTTQPVITHVTSFPHDLYILDVTAQPAVEPSTIYGPLTVADVTAQPSPTPVTPYDHILDALSVTAQPAVEPSTIFGPLTVADVTAQPSPTPVTPYDHIFEAADVTTQPALTVASALLRGGPVSVADVTTQPDVTPAPLIEAAIIALYHFDESYQAAVGQDWVGTPNNDKFLGREFGTAAEITAYNNVISANLYANLDVTLDPSNSSVTIEGFVGMPAGGLATNLANLFGKTGANGTGDNAFFILLHRTADDFRLNMYWYDTSGAIPVLTSDTIYVPNDSDVLFHWAFSIDATTVRCYLNGDIAPQAPVELSSLTFPLRVCNSLVGASKLAGIIPNVFMDELRITDGARYTGSTLTIPTEPSAPLTDPPYVYASTIGVKPQPIVTPVEVNDGTVALYHFDGDTKAAVGQDMDGGNTPVTYYTSEFGLGADLYSSSPARYITLLEELTDAITIEFFFSDNKQTATSGSIPINGKDGAAVTGNNSILWTINRTTPTINAIFYTDGGGTLVLSHPVYPAPGDIWHIAIVLDGGTAHYFVDGVRVGTGALPNGAPLFPLNSVGMNYAQLPQHGVTIDELKISRHAKYTGTTLIIPTAPFEPADALKAVISYPTVQPSVTPVLAADPNADTMALYHFNNTLAPAVGEAWVGTPADAGYVNGWHGQAKDLAAATPMTVQFTEVTPATNGITIEFFVVVPDPLDVPYSATIPLIRGYNGDPGAAGIIGCLFNVYRTATAYYAGIQVYEIDGTAPWSRNVAITPEQLAAGMHVAILADDLNTAAYVDGVVVQSVIFTNGNQVTDYSYLQGSDNTQSGVYIDELRVSRILQYPLSSAPITVPTGQFSPIDPIISANSVTIQPSIAPETVRAHQYAVFVEDVVTVPFCGFPTIEVSPVFSPLWYDLVTPATLPAAKLKGWWDATDPTELYSDLNATTPIIGDGAVVNSVGDKSGNNLYASYIGLSSPASYSANQHNGLGAYYNNSAFQTHGLIEVVNPDNITLEGVVCVFAVFQATSEATYEPCFRVRDATDFQIADFNSTNGANDGATLYLRLGSTFNQFIMDGQEIDLAFHIFAARIDMATGDVLMLENQVGSEFGHEQAFTHASSTTGAKTPTQMNVFGTSLSGIGYHYENMLCEDMTEDEFYGMFRHLMVKFGELEAVSTIDVTAQPSVTPAYIAGTAHLWHLDESLVAATGGVDLNVVSGTAAYVNGVFGTGIDAQSAVYNASLATAIDPATDTFTFECFIRMTEEFDPFARVFLYLSNASFDQALRITGYGSSGDKRFATNVYDATGSIIVSQSSSYLSVSENRHFAVCSNHATGLVEMFMDGDRVYSGTPATTMRDFEIMRIDAGVEVGLAVDEIRISKGIKYSGATITVPTEQFTPISTYTTPRDVTAQPSVTTAAVFSATLSHHRMDGDTLSAIDSANDFVFSGTDTSIYSTTLAESGQTGKAQGSVQPTAAFLSTINLDTDYATFEFWLSADTSTVDASGNWINHTFGNGNAAGDAKIWVACSKGGGATDWQLRFYYVNTSTFQNKVFTLTGKPTTSDLGPIHVAIVYGPSGIELFADGNRLGTATDTQIADTVTQIRSDNDRPQLVYADEIRVTKKALYTGTTYTIPTAPL